jgi:hypothetical protein
MMKEVFLALKSYENLNKNTLQRVEPGHCIVRWLSDASLINDYMSMGWHVYRCYGFQRIVEVGVELKMEEPNECEQCPQTTEPGNKRRR